MRSLQVVAAPSVLALGVLVASCSSGASGNAVAESMSASQSNPTMPSSSTDPEADAKACFTFQLLSTAVKENAVTNTEILVRLQDVNEFAKTSSDSAIRDAAAAMLDRALAGDPEGLVLAIDDMGAACKAGGNLH